MVQYKNLQIVTNRQEAYINSFLNYAKDIDVHFEEYLEQEIGDTNMDFDPDTFIQALMAEAFLSDEEYNDESFIFEGIDLRCEAIEELETEKIIGLKIVGGEPLPEEMGGHVIDVTYKTLIFTEALIKRLNK